MKVWRAILDVLGRRLSKAKPVEEGECAPLLITIYEPDTIESDRDIEVGNRMHKKHVFSRFGGVRDPKAIGIWL